MNLETLNELNKNLFGKVWELFNQPFFLIGTFELTFVKFFLFVAIAWQIVYFINRYFDVEEI